MDHGGDVKKAEDRFSNTVISRFRIFFVENMQIMMVVIFFTYFYRPRIVIYLVPYTNPRRRIVFLRILDKCYD